tara:strand:+ start:19925 stop:20758 length:834 start_codon:yes stop_codon:yes gene_type:complete
MKIRLSDITNFIELASHKTIVAAAANLEITQPALSESLKRLESDIGYSLFYRTKNGIQLTPYGRIFLLKAKAFSISYDNLNPLKNQESEFFNQTITIGCHQTVAQYTLPSALVYLKKVAPDYKIKLVHGLSRDIQDQIQRGQIDIGIIVNANQVPDLVISKLGTDTVAVFSSEHYKSNDTVICNPDLFQTQSILKKWKDKPSKTIHTDDLMLICLLASQNLGYAILPSRAIQFSNFKLKQLTNTPIYKDEISLVYRPEFGKQKAEKLVIESIRKTFK